MNRILQDMIFNGVVYALHLLAKVHILDREVLGVVLGIAREVVG